MRQLPLQGKKAALGETGPWELRADSVWKNGIQHAGADRSRVIHSASVPKPGMGQQSLKDHPVNIKTMENKSQFKGLVFSPVVKTVVHLILHDTWDPSDYDSNGICSQ